MDVELGDDPALITFALAPDRMFHDGNPLLLSAEGESVVKNLVLVGAVLVRATAPGPDGRSQR